MGAAGFRPTRCAVAGVFVLALMLGEGPVLPPGIRPGKAAAARGGAAVLRGGRAAPRGAAAATLYVTGPLALAVTSLFFGKEQGGFGGPGEAARELGAGVRAVGVAAPLVAVRTRLAASRRRREAGEPERR